MFNLELIDLILGIVANALTILLGGVAVYSLLKNRGKLSLLLRYLKISYLRERFKGVEETLAYLGKLDCAKKEHQPEILALFGQLSGQLKAIENVHPDLKMIQEELTQMREKPKRLNEAFKRRIVHSIHSSIDTGLYLNLQNLPESEQ